MEFRVIVTAPEVAGIKTPAPKLSKMTFLE